MSLEVFEKLEAKVQQAIDTITLLQMEIEELKEKNNSLSQEVQTAQQQPERTAEWLAGSSACPAGSYGRSLITLHLSCRSCVGCAQLPQSRSLLRSWGYLRLPPCYNTKPLA